MIGFLIGAAPASCATEPLSPGNNWGIAPADSSSFYRGIVSAYASGAKKVIVPPGRYVITQSSNPGAMVKFDGLKHFTIEASGVTLVFPDLSKEALEFYGCDDVAFLGATITRGGPVTSQGTVTAVADDGKSVDIKIHSGYRADLDDPNSYKDAHVLTFYDPHTLDILPGTFDVWYSGVTRLAPDTFRLALRYALSPDTPITAGKYVSWRNTVHRDIGVIGCAHMRLDRLRFLGGTGFCIQEFDGDGPNHYTYDLTYPPAPPGATVRPLISSNADGFHSGAMRHGPVVENCRLEGMNDDGVPIHGFYGQIMEATGTTVIIRLVWDGPKTWRSGDSLTFLSKENVAGIEAKLLSIEAVPNYKPAHPPEAESNFYKHPHATFYRLTIDRPVNPPYQAFVSDENECGDGFVVRNCTVKNLRGCGMRIQASHGLIEGCTIEGTTYAGILLQADPYWFGQSEYCRDVTICNNTIRRCGAYMRFAAAEDAALCLSGVHPNPIGIPPLPGGFRDIVIKGNTFIDNPGTNIQLTSVIGVRVLDNKMIDPMETWNEPLDKLIDHTADSFKGLGIDKGALIWATQCQDLQISGNKVVRPGKYLLHLVATDATVSGSGFSDGVKAVKK